MRYWYAFTGHHLIMGHGRAVRRAGADERVLRELFESTARYAPTAGAESFIAAMIAPLAAQEFGDALPATPFSSARQLLDLFEGLDIARAAANLFNGRKASAYAAEETGEEGLAARVAQGFREGELLLPQDSARLHAPGALDELPGAVVFLLARAEEERKAFAAYLRRGSPPALSKAAHTVLCSLRPCLPTFGTEARQEKAMRKARHE